MKTLTIIILFIISAHINSQSINSTLGTNGTFSIKNGSTNYFTLSQSTGQINFTKTLRIEETMNSTTGVIYRGTLRFLHTYGNENFFMGENSGNFTTTGPWNTVIGNSTLTQLTTGHSNSVFGIQSMQNNTSGMENSAFGNQSLRSNTTGVWNSAFGLGSLINNVTDSGNSAFGYNSIGGINSGSFNCGFGSSALSLNTSGNYNTALGTFALSNNSTGNYNTAIGWNAGSIITTGSNLTCIGYNSQPSSGTVSNQVTLGNSSVTVLRSAQTTITSLSDARDKKNIKDLTLGIDFIMTLQPRIYNWDKREWYENGINDGTKMKETPAAGFIAQELDEAQTNAGAEWLNLVLKDNPDKWEATPDNLLPITVKAVQELQAEIHENQAVNNGLVNKTEKFEVRLEKFIKDQNMLLVEIEKQKSENAAETVGAK